MLHLVLQRALADARNQRYISVSFLRYPKAKLILVHAGRGFCGRHTAEGIDFLRGLDNISVDRAAVCDPEAFEAVLETFGTTRLMYGSDFPLSGVHGGPISVGDGFCWIYDCSVDWSICGGLCHHPIHDRVMETACSYICLPRERKVVYTLDKPCAGKWKEFVFE